MKLSKSKAGLIRLGVDVRDLRLASTGTRTYLEEFLREAARLNTKVELVRLDSLWKPYWGNSKWGKAFEHISFFIWKQITLPIKAFFKNIDVLFCTDYYVPNIKLKARHMVVFHDAIFFDHPEYYNPVWLKMFRSIALPAARKADAIIVPSQFSADRLSFFEPSFSSRMFIVSQGPKSFGAAIVPSISLIKYSASLSTSSQKALKQLNGSAYFLHVGVLEKRKNLDFLVEALKEVREHQDVKLVLIGKPNPKIFNNSFEAVMDAVSKNQLEEQVILAGYLPDEDLPFWYSNALAYIFPSRYEGFGIPVLEAFHFKVPVAVANNSCLPEIGGDAVLTFSPDDKQELVAVMLQLAGDRSCRQALAEKGSRRFEQFTWKGAAHEIIRIACRL